MIDMLGIRKSFGSINVLDGVNFHIGESEIVGIIGDNAAGKSTLMKMLSGAYSPDSGDIVVGGMHYTRLTPETSRTLGVEMVYQDLALADNLDVAGNVFMGRELTGRLGIIKQSAMRASTRLIITSLGIDIDDVSQLVKTLSGGQRQAVAIARAMAFDAKVVILDEPTANLSPASSAKVLEIVKALKAAGVSVVLINHRMDEVERISDRIVVLSHGRVLNA